MRTVKHCPKKGLAAKVDGQWWRIKSQTDYAKALLLRKKYASFYKNGLRHREDGPAVVWASGHEEWYLNGEFIKHETP